MKELEVKVIVTGSVRGEAIVSKKPISFLGGVAGKKGIIADIQSELHGKSIKDKIFVFPESVGSTVGSYVIYSL
ncbi:MAG: aconitase X swivel domain-containing protein, partial [Candidatus Heimdallarchaeaceae archaeon]